MTSDGFMAGGGPQSKYGTLGEGSRQALMKSSAAYLAGHPAQKPVVAQPMKPQVVKGVVSAGKAVRGGMPSNPLQNGPVKLTPQATSTLWNQKKASDAINKPPAQSMGQRLVQGVKAIPQIPGAMVGALKSGVRNDMIGRQASAAMANRIAPEGVAGSANFDTHATAIRGFLKKGDINGANNYMDQQSAKMRTAQPTNSVNTLQ